jgi:hypothetical protein
LDLQNEEDEASEIDDFVVSAIELVITDIENLSSETKLSFLSSLTRVAEREANTVIELGEDLDLDAGIQPETGEKIVETGITLMNSLGSHEINDTLSDSFLVLIRTAVSATIKHNIIGESSQNPSISIFATKIDYEDKTTLETFPLSEKIELTVPPFSYETRRALAEENECLSTSLRIFALPQEYFILETVNTDIASEEFLVVELVCDDTGEIIPNVSFEEENQLEFTFTDYVRDIKKYDEQFICKYIENGALSKEGMETVEESADKVVCKSTHLSEFGIEEFTPYTYPPCKLFNP